MKFLVQQQLSLVRMSSYFVFNFFKHQFNFPQSFLAFLFWKFLVPPFSIEMQVVLFNFIRFIFSPPPYYYCHINEKVCVCQRGLWQGSLVAVSELAARQRPLTITLFEYSISIAKVSNLFILFAYMSLPYLWNTVVSGIYWPWKQVCNCLWRTRGNFGRNAKR